MLYEVAEQLGREEFHVRDVRDVSPYMRAMDVWWIL